MTEYHAQFCITGEVVEMLTIQTPQKRLLIDISATPSPEMDLPDFVYRTSFTVFDLTLIATLQEQISPGDVIEAKGMFWQTGYVPHKKGQIDTTFSLTNFRLITKQANSCTRHNPFKALLSNLNMH